jgi:hypothetical protein
MRFFVVLMAIRDAWTWSVVLKIIPVWSLFSVGCILKARQIHAVQ